MTARPKESSPMEVYDPKINDMNVERRAYVLSKATDAKNTLHNLKGGRESMTDFEYYWEKAEFQDPVAHRMHVENYKNGIHDSVAFDEQYQKEAKKELKKEKIK